MVKIGPSPWSNHVSGGDDGGRVEARRVARLSNNNSQEQTLVKVIVRDRETIQEAVRRFGKLVMRSGLKKEMRRRKYYEKPSDIKRRARLRAQRRNAKGRL